MSNQQQWGDPQWGQPGGPGQFGGPQQADAPKSRPWKHWLGYPLVALVFTAVGTSLSEPAATQIADPPASVTETTQPVGAKKPAEAKAEPAAPKAKSAANKSGPGIGDKVRDGKFQFTVTKVTGGSSVGSDVLGVKAQGRFVFVHLRVENIGDKPQSLFGDAQQLFDSKGRKFSANTEAAIYVDDSNTLWEEINPGNVVKGIVVFDLPKKAIPTRLELHDSVFSGGVEVSLK